MSIGRPPKYDRLRKVNTNIEEDEYSLLKEFNIPAMVAMTWGIFTLVEPRILRNPDYSPEDRQNFYRIRERAMNRISDCLLSEQKDKQSVLPTEQKPTGELIIPPESPIRIWNEFDHPGDGRTEYIPRSRFDPDKYTLRIAPHDLIHVIDTLTHQVVQVDAADWRANPKRYDIRLGGRHE